jgi:hypothetical protein
MRPLVAVILVLAVVYCWFRVESNESAEPAACQLLGGQWTLWSGWRCG